jgi:hypothetical protein
MYWPKGIINMEGKTVSPRGKRILEEHEINVGDFVSVEVWRHLEHEECSYAGDCLEVLAKTDGLIKVYNHTVGNLKSPVELDLRLVALRRIDAAFARKGPIFNEAEFMYVALESLLPDLKRVLPAHALHVEALITRIKRNQPGQPTTVDMTPKTL